MCAARANLGTLASRLFPAPLWTDGYPSSTEWKNEFDTLLAFADSQKQLPRFLTRLNTPRNNQRDEALNELRVAFFFHCNRFPIFTWEPPGKGGKIGEYSIKAPEGSAVFTEVKSRGWESELTQAERLAGRTKLPKYLDGDGGPFANWQGVRACISAAYPKFLENQPNLLVIADDFFVSLVHGRQQLDIALYEGHLRYGGECGYFTNADYANVGGLGVFAASAEGSAVTYVFQVFSNPHSLTKTTLPESLLSLRS